MCLFILKYWRDPVIFNNEFRVLLLADENMFNPWTWIRPYIPSDSVVEPGKIKGYNYLCLLTVISENIGKDWSWQLIFLLERYSCFCENNSLSELLNTKTGCLETCLKIVYSKFCAVKMSGRIVYSFFCFLSISWRTCACWVWCNTYPN